MRLTLLFVPALVARAAPAGNELKKARENSRRERSRRWSWAMIRLVG